MARTWLKTLLTDSYLPAIAPLNDNHYGRAKAKRLCEQLRDDWTQRGFLELEQQQGLMDETRKLLKQVLGEEHFCLDFIKFSREEGFELNRMKQERARGRQLHQQFISNPDEIVAKAVGLLKSPEWAEVAAAIALLTGRRLNEVLKTAQFEIKSKWVVTFSGALKRRGETVPLVFDIPTLTTAQRVVEATERLRQITPAGADEKKVGLVCDRVFADLVPRPPGKDNLYAHLWRSLYACIASFWYCPTQVDDLLFKAHIMGHFETLSGEELTDGGLRRQRLESFSSERHYRLYEIADEVIAQHNGKRKGIKLGHAGIEPLEVFAVGMVNNQTAPGERKLRSTMRIWKDDRDSILLILQHFDGNNQMEKTAHWINWSLERLDEGAIAQTPAQQQDREDSPTPETNKTAPVPQPEQVQAIAYPLDHSHLDPKKTSSLETQIADLVTVMRQFVQLQSHSQPDKMTRQRKSQHKQDIHQGVEQKSDGDRSSPPKTGRKRGSDDDFVNRAIDAIVQYNNSPGRTHDDKWFITTNLLKKFTPKGNQRAAQRAIDDRGVEIEKHHQQHQLKGDHNNRHKKHDVTMIIQL